MNKKELAISIISHMRFSAVQYITEKDTLLQNAISEFHSKSGFVSKAMEHKLSLLLEQSFEERKHFSVSSIDMPYSLMNGSYFRMCIDDTLVEGQVSITPKIISVEITEPYSGRSATSKLAMLAPIIWTVDPITGSEANKSGKEKAVSLLTDIYYTILMENKQ